MNQSPLYEIEILPCGKVEVTWETLEGKKAKTMKPEELEDGIRELVLAFVDGP